MSVRVRWSVLYICVCNAVSMIDRRVERRESRPDFFAKKRAGQNEMK